MKKLLFLVYLLIISPLSIYADDWELYEEGTITKLESDYQKLEEQLKNKVSILNKNSINDEGPLTIYKYSITKLNTYNMINEDKYVIKQIDDENTFNSKVDAMNYFNNLQLPFNERKFLTTITENSQYSYTESKYYKTCTTKECILELEELNEKYPGNVSEIKEEQEENTVLGVEQLALEEANNLKNILEQSNKTVTLREGTEVVIQEKSISIASKLLSASFKTKEAAVSAINNLILQGYIIEGLVDDLISEVILEGTGYVSTGSKISQSKEVYQFAETSNYVVIKQASNGLVVWTELPLTTTAQENFKQTYKETCLNYNFDGKSNCNLPILQFISSYQTFDLSNLGNGWKNTYTFSKVNGIITLAVPQGAVSHTIDGIATLSTKEYIIEGNMHKNTIIQKYYVDYMELINKYSLFYKERFVSTNYKLNYQLYTYDCLNYIDLAWKIEKQELGMGGDNPPHTGIDDSNELSNSLLLLLFILIVKRMFIK